MINRRGFTLVEVIVIIVVIAILATIASLGLNRYLEDGRDNRRTANVTVISEALEKYYDENGEYPSCAAITAAAPTVTQNTLKGLDQSALLVPNPDASTTNSIRCGSTLTAGGPSNDFIEYVGDGSADCSGAGSCLTYKLRYRSEAENTVVELNSRRTTDIATSSGGNLSATPNGFTGINLSWSAVQNSVSYTLQRATTSDFTTGLVTTSPTTNSASVTGLTAGTEYFFRVRGDGASQTGSWSNTASAITRELGDLTITATVNSSSQITTNWNTVANADGTTRYTVQRATDTSFTAGVVSQSNLSSTSYVWTGLAVGQNYYFRVQATATGDTSEWSNTAASVTIPPAPTGVVATVNSATQYTISWNASPGASSYIVRYGTSSSANQYSATTTNTSVAISANILQGTLHYFKVYAVSTGLESPASATVSGRTPINPPGTFNISRSTTSTSLSSSATSASCPSGTTRYYLWRANGSTWVQGTGYGSVTYNLSPGQSVTLSASVKCIKSGATDSSYRNSSNSQSHSRAGMNLTLSAGSDGCTYGYCGRTVYANWNNVCGTGRPTISAKQLSTTGTWLADTSSNDEIKFKGASSPGVRVTYTVPIGCTTGTASIYVISAYKCTGCS